MVVSIRLSPFSFSAPNIKRLPVQDLFGGYVRIFVRQANDQRAGIRVIWGRANQQACFFPRVAPVRF
jgi:hypothetical protein